MASAETAQNRGTTAPSRILIVLLGAIGDVVRALPLLGRIRHGWPDSHIAWAVEPKSEPVLRNHPWLDEIILFDRARVPWSVVPFLSAVGAGHYDLVLDLQRTLKSGIISRISGAPERVGFSAANTKELNHLFSTRHTQPQQEMKLKLLQYQAFGDALGLPASRIEFGLRATDEERERVRELLGTAERPLLAVILGSSWPSRVYIPESIAAVIRDLSSASGPGRRLFPVLLGGPEEVALGRDVVGKLAGAPVIDLSGRTSLRDLVAILPECAVAFGPDSGPMHIAAATGCPVVSLWGATAPERSAPWGFEKFVLRGEIPCHPCYLRRCPIGRECMHRITPQSVIEAVRRALDERSASGTEAGPQARVGS